MEQKGNSLRDNPDGTCNCRPLGSGCFFTDGMDGKCKCKCHAVPSQVEKKKIYQCKHILHLDGLPCEDCEEVSQIEDTQPSQAEPHYCETIAIAPASLGGGSHTIHRGHCKECKVEDTQPSREWEKEFDEKFSNTGYRDPYGNYSDSPFGPSEIKAFIRSLLLTERSKLVGEIEGMKREILGLVIESDCLNMGYNQALNDILSLLNKKI